jgi:hypothetical protein
MTIDLSKYEYEKCAHCHLFVDLVDEADALETASYTHMARGDDDDNAIEESHDAEPSGEKHLLDWWYVHGPLAMRARFEVDLYEQTLGMQSLGLFDEYSTTALVEFITDGRRDLGTTTFRRDFEEWLEIWERTGHGKLITHARLDRLMPTV